MLGMTAPLFQGIAIGAFVVTALVSWRSELSQGAKVSTILTCLSAAAWVLRESEQGAAPLGIPQVFLWLAFPAAGCFWAFVVCVFLDRPLHWLLFAPAALLLISGFAITETSVGDNPAVLAIFNIAAAVLCLHAVYLIIRSWRGDLVDGRRISRFVILGIGALFAAAQGAAGALHWLGGGEAQFAVGESLGAFAVSVLALSMGSVLLEARSPVFAKPVPPQQGTVAPGEPSAQAETAVDAKLVAADRMLLAKLTAFMEADGWRRDGLSIGEVAHELGTQEHRLRRLINARLGHRNFADFVNGYRIDAAKARLADPAQASVTIASIAFDLGFGSLSPFNRAFRAATGSTPTEWRRSALAATPANPV
jgi:AraC-like DNA-binding protein